jgi:hypothetical protein
MRGWTRCRVCTWVAMAEGWEADFDRLCSEVGGLAERIERVRELRARRGRDLSPAQRAKAEQLLLENGRLMAVLLACYAQGEG